MNGLAGLISARYLRCPLYVDCDDYEAEANRFSGAWQRWLVQWWEDHLPPWADGVTVNTRFSYERCRALGVAPKRMVYVPNGISAAQCQRPSEAQVQALRTSLGLTDAPTVIYLGTMSRVAHGVGLLLDAFTLLRRQLPTAHLLMVGDGDDRADLQAQAQQLGISEVVHWVGLVPSEDAPLYLALVDCSVDPVYDTPAMRGRSPLKIVESLAAGVPVVTGDVGDRREMLADGEAGVIVKAGDATALAKGIVTLLENHASQERLAAHARQRAEAYRWKWLVEEWVKVYRTTYSL
jgi:glycosyltransferase involved in cell wall biosynthesis